MICVDTDKNVHRKLNMRFEIVISILITLYIEMHGNSTEIIASFNIQVTIII